MVKQVNKEKLSITIDTEVFHFIADLAEKDDRSFSSMVNIILRDYMREKQKESD